MKDLKSNSFIKTEGLLWEGVLKSVKKSQNRLQPLFEAITNSIESICLLHSKYSLRNNHKDFISLQLHYNKSKDLFGEEKIVFNKIIISDSGIGFDDENFERAFVYKDTRKGFNNRGSGRIQFLHFFNKCNVDSVYIDNNIYLQRKFSLSKAPNYLKENAIIFYIGTEKNEVTERKTTITLEKLLDEKDMLFYDDINIAELKDIILLRYMMYFCLHRDNLPEFSIIKYIDNELIESNKITIDDIPEYDQESTLPIYYSTMPDDMKRIDRTSNKEEFKIQAFKINKNKLQNNEIKLTIKGEVIDSLKLKLDNLKPEDTIEDNRYLFLISSEYLNELSGDDRNELPLLLNKTDFKKSLRILDIVKKKFC